MDAVMPVWHQGGGGKKTGSDQPRGAGGGKCGISSEHGAPTAGSRAPEAASARSPVSRLPGWDRPCAVGSCPGAGGPGGGRRTAVSGRQSRSGECASHHDLVWEIISVSEKRMENCKCIVKIIDNAFEKMTKVGYFLY